MDASKDEFGSGAPVALVTGGGSGIGRATAVQFAKAGCNVVAVDVNREGAEETCSLIKAAAPTAECIAVPCDITSPDQVASMIAATKEAFGRLDYAFNNAGISGRAAPIHEMPLEEWDRIMSVNLRGHFIAMQAEIPLMLKTAPSPAIVLTSSICGHQAHPGMSAYTASKFAVRGLVKAAAVEYGPRGLRVNSVSPGAISTPLLLNFVASEGGATVAHLIAEGAKLEEPNVTAAAKEEASAESTAEAPATPTPAEAPAAADTRPTTAAGAPGAPPGGEATTKAPSSEAERPNTLPLRRLGEPEDIASAVVWLCMQGHYVTGTDLLIDGGSMCRVTPS